MLSLVPQCHNGLLVPRGTTVSNMFPSFQESLRSSTGPLVPWALQCHNGPIITRGPALSQCSAWSHKALQCHSCLCGSMRSLSIPMNSLVLQCHNGALVTQDPAVSPGTLGSMGHHSVTIVPLVPRVLAMEQWPLDSIGPQAITRLSLVPQCHNGPLHSQGSAVSQSSQNDTRWKRPLSASRPTCDPTPPCQPDHGTQ